MVTTGLGTLLRLTITNAQGRLKVKRILTCCLLFQRTAVTIPQHIWSRIDIKKGEKITRRDFDYLVNGAAQVYF